MIELEFGEKKSPQNGAANNGLMFGSQLDIHEAQGNPTLNEITDYLMKEDAELHSAMTNAE